MEAGQMRRYAVVCVPLLALVMLVWGELLAGRATSRDMGGDERYLTYVATDKPIYRPGEKVYVRGVMLNARHNSPLLDGLRVSAMVEIKGPKGDTVASGYAAAQDSVLAFAWDVPAGQAGGEYTIKFSYPGYGYAPAERKFDIRAYRAPRLKSQIVFLRDGYGPGDNVGATLHVERAEGGIPAGAKVNAIARVDGEEVFNGPATVDPTGNCTVGFKLPAEIARGEGSLAMIIEDGGVVETAAKTIPILLQTINLRLYPEGGDLVAGLLNRVYIEGKTPAQKPADLAGIIVDAAGKKVAEVRTEHEGRGRFTFIPEKGGKYTLKITEPAGIKTTYPLPAVKDEGVVIRSVEERTGKGEDAKLRVGSSSSGNLTVTLSRREFEVASTKISVKAGQFTDVSLTPPTGAEGVLIATVWDANGDPLAERLIFRQPAKSVRISVTSEKKNHVPGDKVDLTVKATDDEGNPVSAVVGLTVTDDSVLEMIEKREQAPRLAAMALLEADVRELADAHVYLDEMNPKAPLALDLLLGTQGWRRFALVDTVKFIQEHGDAARRVLALRLVSKQELAKGMAPGRGGRLEANRLGGIEEEALAMNGIMPAEDAGAPPPAPAAPGVEVPPVEGKPMAQLAPGDKAQAAGEPKLAELKDNRAGLLEAIEKADEKRARGELAAGRPMQDRVRRVRQQFAAVRVYAHELRPERKAGDRADFAETLYWNAGTKTDPKTGECKISFALSDAVTTFRVSADAFSAGGALGQGSSAVESVEPFYIEPKLPLEVSSGDVILLPVSVVNGVSSEQPEATVAVQTSKEIEVAPVKPFALPGDARVRQILQIRVGAMNAAADFVVRGQAGPYTDTVNRRLSVRPLGFPVEVASGGMLGPANASSHAITIPAGVVPRSITTNAAVYPTPLANLTEALERLIQEPNGCFEQTSSTAYPLVMAQQYFLTHAGVPPALIERSRERLDRGYNKLAGFECKQRGYEWFGGDPGHEALTAYGLLEFTDMGQVREVDAKMTERTRQWLLDRRDGKGGFQRNARALDSFGGAPEDTTNAYVVWALMEAGQKNIDKEIAAVKQQGETTKDSYIVALAANVAGLSGDQATAKKLMDKLVKNQTKDGFVDGAVTSITRSGGEALKIETTALSVLAWLRDPAYAGSVENAIRYIAESCKAGRFGSTQSTVLALRAIVTYDKQRARPKEAGAVQLVVDGHAIGGPMKFDKDTQGAIKLPDFSELLEPGKHTVELKMENGSSMPFSLAVNYNNAQPASATECKVGLNVALKEKAVAEGAITEANVTVTNLSKEAIPMPVAIVGLPGGLEPRHDQLKELVKSGKIDAYEVLGREVVLYWRGMKPDQRTELPLSLVAAVPGTYAGPASRAYLYYTDEFKNWVEGLKIDILPRAEM
jgi:hypothetical protein